MIGATLPNNNQTYHAPRRHRQRRLLWDRDTVAGCGHQLFHPERQQVILLHREPGARRLLRCAEPEMYVGAAHRGVCSAVRTSHNDVPCNLGTTSGSAQAQRRRRRGPRSSAAPRAASLSQRTRLSVNSRPHSHPPAPYQAISFLWEWRGGHSHSDICGGVQPG